MWWHLAGMVLIWKKTLKNWLFELENQGIDYLLPQIVIRVLWDITNYSNRPRIKYSQISPSLLLDLIK